MGSRHIRVRVQNNKEKFPSVRSYRGKRRYILYLTRYDYYWNGTESLSLKDLEIIRDYLNQYIYNEKSRRKRRKDK